MLIFPVRPAFYLAVVLLIAGCGGGDGGGNSTGTGSSTTTPPTNPVATLSLSTSTVAAIVNLTQAAPVAGFSVGISTQVATSAKFYIKGTFTKHAIASIAASDSSGDNYSIQFEPPAALGVGTYQDTVTIEGCYDSACSQQVSNSPQTVTVTYTVIAGPGTLTSLNPDTAQVGVAFTLTVNGSGFVAGSSIMFNGNPVATTFVSATQLTAAIGAAAVPQARNYDVYVVPSLLDGNTFSNTLELTVAPLPMISALTPGTVVAGLPGFSLTVTGSNFGLDSVVIFGGAALVTTWQNGSLLTATVTSAQVLNAGTVPVIVASSSNADALLSAPSSFTVQPLPALASNSVDPSIVNVGGQGFVLTVLGQGFMPSAVVQWNGTALQTAYVSELELQAQLPAANLASIGTAAVTVQNSGSGAAAGAPLTVKITAALPDAVSLQINPAHTGAISYNSLTFPTSSTWSANVGGPASYAVVADGKVVVAVSVNNGSQLMALDQATGGVVWGPMALAGHANLAYEGGKVFVLSTATGSPGAVQSYDIESGAADWSVTLNTDVEGGLVALNGMLYTSGDNGLLYALSEATGSVVWSASIANGGFGTPAATATGVYVSYPCTTYGYLPLSGAQIFNTNTGCQGSGGTTPVAVNGWVYSPSGSSSMGGAIIDASSGSVLGSYTAIGEPAFSTIAGYFLQGATLNALSNTNNAALWSFAGDGNLTTSPIIVNQAVIIGSSSGNVYALDATTGQQLWTVNAGGTLPATNSNSGLAAGDGLLIVPAGNQVVAYTLSANP